MGKPDCKHSDLRDGEGDSGAQRLRGPCHTSEGLLRVSSDGQWASPWSHQLWLFLAFTSIHQFLKFSPPLFKSKDKKSDGRE